MARSGRQGTIPDGWEVVRLGEVAEVNPRRPRLTVHGDTPVTFLPMAAIAEGSQGIISRESRPFSQVVGGYTYFEENDFLFAKITPCLQNGKHTLATGLKDGFGFGTTEFHVVRASGGLTAAFMFWLLTQAHIIDHCSKSFVGTAGQQRVRPEILKDLPIHLPPLAEQRAIAAVLDSIDDAIERTDAVIAATEQLRDSLLHELLTRGVPGWHTEWREAPGIGTIPADWEVVRLGEVCQSPRYGAAAPAQSFDRGLPRYVRITDITDDGRLLNEDAASADPLLVAGYELKPGDLLFARSGATVGKTYLYRPEDGPCVYAGYLIRFRCFRSTLLPEFLERCTRSHYYRRWVESMFRAGAQPNINAAEYSSLPIPIPSLSEQHAIAALLDGVDRAIERGREEREKLKVLKESAADALLTGRVRVSIVA